jgi:transcriptional regulator with XRE-family HTH domain
LLSPLRCPSVQRPSERNRPIENAVAIRELRQKRGSSLESLAPKAGLALNTLSLSELGQANPTWETVKGIAAALDVSIADLAKLSLKFEDSSQK